MTGTADLFILERVFIAEMANNKQLAVNAVQTKAVEVSQQLQDGEKFIKWDEVSYLLLYCSWENV